MSKLDYLVRNAFVKKAEYDEVVKKVDSIQTADSSNLVTKADCNTKIGETEKKIPKFNKLTAENFIARLKQAKLATKGNIANFVKETDFDEKLKNINKVTLNKSKHVLAENELNDLSEKVKLSTSGCNFLFGRIYFTRNDGYQNFLVFFLSAMLNSLTLDNNKKVTWFGFRPLP